MEEFSFPFPPYRIQEQLMREITQCIECNQVGIFESPTGTGKSLSVLCATLTWLENFERSYEEQLLAKANAALEDEQEDKDWVAAHKRKMERSRDVEDARDRLAELRSIKEKVDRAKKGLIDTRKRKHVDVTDPTTSSESVDELAPSETYNSDDEDRTDDPLAGETLKTVKIYYASRTHSQLEQLVDELAKTRFKPRLVTAASRQTLCANAEVQRLKINHLINEKCMELRKNGSGGKKSCGDKNSKGTKKAASKNSCCYFKSDAIEELSNAVLATHVSRPSEVLSRGQQTAACPYFATRKAMPLCQLVLLPYQVLLHSATRAAWGVDLKDNVVVLDEAHNVLQTIGSLYSVELAGGGLSVALSLIRQYIDTYKTRLKSKNLMYMRQLLTVVTSLDRYIRSDAVKEDEVVTIQALIIRLGLTDVNLFKLVQYVETTDLCKKFHGFYIRSQKKEVVTVKNAPPPTSGIARLMAKKKEVAVPPPEPVAPVPTEPPRPIPSPLFAIKSFLESLNNRCEDGRIILDKKNTKYRFILLNPADRLYEVVKEARATILVGGTMEPAGLLVDSLSRGGSAGSIRRFSCQHVIDDNQLIVLSIGKTFDERPFSLTFQTRNDSQVVRSLGLTLVQLVGSVPNGCVAFFPSYDYMFYFFEKMKQLQIVSKLQEKKVLYLEPRGASGDIWAKFVTSARSDRGALLCAVVGGKLSEGINFSDELGRAVIMIGLPYPNKNSVELREKMKFLDQQLAGGGKQLYDSLCMHSVNQAVGRAIRHRNDYAAVFLLDQRFTQTSVKSQLSTWIGSRAVAPPTFGETLRMTQQFFKNAALLKKK